MRQRLTTALAALVLAGAFAAGPVQGHTQNIGGNCSTGYAYFWGNAEYQPYPHPLQVCYGLNVLRLSAYSDLHEGSNRCPGFLSFDDGDWNNCITSVTVHFGNVPSGVKLCLYDGESWTGNTLVVIGGWSTGQLSSTYNDRFSSVKWATTC